MKVNPRLDLFTFEIKPKDKSFKTFGDFVLSEIDKDTKIEDMNKTLLSFFMSNLDSDNAKNSRAQKMVCLVEKEDKNKHLDKKPSFNEELDIISGVINGGPFGKDGILMNIENKDDSETLSRNKTVLSYYYIFLYMPKDHRLGLAMIHSNRMEENLCGVFKEFIRKSFRSQNYYSPEINDYCPKKFQEEFKQNASIQKITFKHTFVENTHSSDPIVNLLSEYDIQITAIPKEKGILARNADKLKQLLSRKKFSINSNQSRALDQFTNTELTLKETDSKTQRTFEWSTRDNDFVPVIYLEGKLEKTESDGTPDFLALKDYCLNLFNNDILSEIRPDNNVQRID